MMYTSIGEVTQIDILPEQDCLVGQSRFVVQPTTEIKF